jgi:hypothetical protein
MDIAQKTQLLTGFIIWLAAAVGYLGTSIYYKKLNRWDLLSFLKYFMIAGFMIGTHQVFEFLSLYTNNQIIYKIGLLCSISGMVLYLISLEKFYNRNLYAKYFWFVIGGLGFYLFMKPVEFNAFAFHLEHHSIFFWTFVWLIMFLYWNICIILEQKQVSKFIPNLLSWIYLLFSMTISFLVSIGYSLWNYYVSDVNICITYPSIWCTFAVLQILVMPIFLYFLPHKMRRLPPKTRLSKKFLFRYLFVSLVIAIFIITFLIYTGCFDMNFIFS